MIKGNENFINMAKATKQVLDNNNSIWASNILISDDVAHTQTVLDQVETEREAAKIVSTGATLDKDIAADAAIELAVLLGGYAEIYARKSKNQNLAAQVNYSHHSLDKLPNNDLYATITKLHSTLSGLDIKNLALYGITQGLLDDLKTKTEYFNSIKSNTRVIITDRKTHNANIPALIRDLRETFKDIDGLIPVFKEDYPDFVNQYFNARIIIDLRGPFTQDKDKPSDNQ